MNRPGGGTNGNTSGNSNGSSRDAAEAPRSGGVIRPAASGADASSTAARYPQQDRSRATRAQVLEAALECLAELGWSRCTMAAVASRAAVSRGALQHHFPTREDLFAAAVEHTVEVRSQEIRRQVAALGDASMTTREVVEVILSMHTGTAFNAALELWVASAADPVLRELIVPLEARVGREIHKIAVDLLGADESQPGVRELIQATLDLARGLGLANLLTDDSRRRSGIADRWAVILDTELSR